MSLKWTSKYFVKKYIELARNHFHISTKIVIFLGNYQGNSLEQTLTNMETHTVASKKKKKKSLIVYLYCEESFQNHSSSH